MRQLEIVRKDLAPGQLKIFGVLIVLATNYKLLTFTFHEVNPAIFIVGNLVAFAIWSAKDIMVIDFDKNVIGEGFKIFGLRYTDKTKFSTIEKIYINSVNTGETFRQLTRTMSIHHEGFKAFLKTIEGDKFWIAMNTDKDKLIRRLKKYNTTIMTEIYDNTEREQTRVD